MWMPGGMDFVSRGILFAQHTRQPVLPPQCFREDANMTLTCVIVALTTFAASVPAETLVGDTVANVRCVAHDAG
jgi:hypothetical protein